MKKFSPDLIEALYYQEKEKAESEEYIVGQKVIVYDRKCRHFHKGEILERTDDSWKVLYKDLLCQQMSEANTNDLKKLTKTSEYPNYKSLPNNANLNFIKNIDLGALTLLLRLLETKYFQVQKLSEIQALEEQTEQSQADRDYYMKNIDIVDNYIKNAILILRIKTNSNFKLEDLVKNYIFIVTQIKNEIKKQNTEEKEEWVKKELHCIQRSLNRKLERKILHDTQQQVGQEFGFEEKYKD